MIGHPGGHNHEENWDGDNEDDDNEVGNYGMHPFFWEVPKLPNYAPPPAPLHAIWETFFYFWKSFQFGWGKGVFFLGFLPLLERSQDANH